MEIYAYQKLLEQDGSFQRLVSSWQEQLSSLGVADDLAALPYIDHAGRIARENGLDQSYGVFGLRDENKFHALVHANVAMLPRTTGRTLRLLWILLAPIYDYEDAGQDDIAAITASIIHGAIGLANGEMSAKHVKLHLQNVGDRRFAIALAFELKQRHSGMSVAVRGNWLHFDDIS